MAADKPAEREDKRVERPEEPRVEEPRVVEHRAAHLALSAEARM